MMYHVQKQFIGHLRTVVMFLDESHYHAAAKLAHHFDDTTELAFQPTIFIFSRTAISDLESLNDVRLVPLYPLCNIESEQIKVAVPEWAKQIKMATSISEKDRRDLLALLSGFMIHRIKSLTLTEINQVFGDFKMEDTQVGKELMEIGGLEMLRENLSDLITTKLGRPERAWFEQMNALNDLALLKNLYRAILHAKSPKQVKEALDGALGNGKKTLIKGK